ncbi:MAG: elongation factor 4 [Deltaproteobacteria bacterium]|nr:elongation factor 4 [Deltaproteobacteria bacterium]
MTLELIRNFSIIAHVDHGKSTLADRILELTGAISDREKKDQFLDKMELERERGITIKAQTVRLHYRAKDGKDYLLNLIDTPGHVDFHYEVSRSLAACEGALLVVDAAQGVEAQTLANAYLAADNNLELLPVINKMDLPTANPEKVKRQIEEIVGISAKEAILASAKSGTGISEILEGILKKIPPPKGNPEGPLRALLFDSWFDQYLGVVVLVRVVDGRLTPGMKIRFIATERDYEIQTLGVFSPHPTMIKALETGEVGFFTATIKSVHETKIGDTITEPSRPASTPLPGFKEVKPVVFAGFYPVETVQYEALKMALEKLNLNDASFHYEAETSKALGFGFRLGFLGLLHMDIIRERLRREYSLALVTTAPTVAFRVKTIRGEQLEVDNPQDLPPEQEIAEIQEPFIRAKIQLPTEYLGNVIRLCVDRRGVQTEMTYLSPERVLLVYEIPFMEIMFDFYDRLKSITQGYASFDYEILEWRPSDLILLNILVNGEMVDALSIILHRENAYQRGREIAEKLRKEIPRQMYEVAIQAAIGSRIIARESVSALRKNVTAKCYGGDITRKRKLLEKQKAGKKRMKQVGSVEIPPEAFFNVLKVD